MTKLKSRIERWRGINQAVEPALLPPGQLSDARNMVEDQSGLRKRGGFGVDDGTIWYMDAREYWPLSIFNFRLSEFDVDDAPWPDVATPDAGNGLWLGYPGTDPVTPDAPDVVVPSIIRREKVLRKKFIIDLPATIYPGFPFSLTVQCWDNAGDGLWTPDLDYDGDGADWKAYTFTEGAGHSRVTSGELKLASGNNLYLDGDLIDPADAQWGDWAPSYLVDDCVLLDADGHDKFMFVAEYRGMDAGNAIAAVGVDLRPVILERQKAAGITPEISLTTVYTFAQYQTYINQLGPYFVDGEYSGGASQPTMMAADIADGADNVEALLELLYAMEETKKSCQWNSDGNYWEVRTAGYETKAEAWQALQDATPTYKNPYVGDYHDVYLQPKHFPGWNPPDYRFEWYISDRQPVISSGISGEVAHSGRFFLQSNMRRYHYKTWGDFTIYSTQGQPAGPEQSGWWKEAGTRASGVWTSVARGDCDEAIWDPSIPPVDGYDWEGSGYGDSAGFGVETTGFALLTWDFEYTGD